ncbi:hypothetical protein PDE_03395 [Penicillium oxalicum 114-2]|uniref:Uncharacterized protein n=1 Tax=Penicillium oxalicum (strain 114-2 / CGMCC 5302) TaxID=933388 RepID=S7ZDU3_PENO1|nr:hypothetical protein PDE_03395 [Penicillium oxalicum 114-2]
MFRGRKREEKGAARKGEKYRRRRVSQVPTEFRVGGPVVRAGGRYLVKGGNSVEIGTWSNLHLQSIIDVVGILVQLDMWDADGLGVQ